MTQEDREIISQAIGALWALSNFDNKTVRDTATVYADLLQEMLDKDADVECRNCTIMVK